MKNELLYLSGVDIPFAEAITIIHNPTIREISYIGEEDFFTGCNLIASIKKLLNLEDKSVISDASDFQIFMSIICDKNYTHFKKTVINVLSLLFPNYEVNFYEDYLLLTNEKMGIVRINELNFEQFQQIIRTMFCLDHILNKGATEYNPQGTRAEKIAEKFKKARAKVQQLNSQGESKDINIFSRYVSVLAVGKSQDINTLLNYTVFQLFDEFQRFENKTKFDYVTQARMAGAKIDEVDHWMDSIHP